jgi:hypothetical protein
MMEKEEICETFVFNSTLKRLTTGEDFSAFISSESLKSDMILKLFSKYLSLHQRIYMANLSAPHFVDNRLKCSPKTAFLSEVYVFSLSFQENASTVLSCHLFHPIYHA